MLSKFKLLSVAACSTLLCGALARADDMMATTTYDVTITNLTNGQPLSPPIVIAHKPTMHVWEMGKMCSPEMQKVAEGGMTGDLVKMLEGKATDIAGAKMDEKVMPGKSITLKVKAHAGDVISVASMVSASNDTFTGVDSCPIDEAGMKMKKEMMAKDGMMNDGMKGGDTMAKDGMKAGEMMMKDGAMTTMAMAMDAGTEENTEKKSDTAAPDMGMGHPATDPQHPISMSEGIKGTGDLDKAMFGWTGPVAKIEIKKTS